VNEVITKLSEILEKADEVSIYVPAKRRDFVLNSADMPVKVAADYVIQRMKDLKTRANEAAKAAKKDGE
jgi:hypothetical protein